MNTLDRVLLILHFLGLALGFSVSFANMVMSGLMARAAPSEKLVLGRFPPLMSRLGSVGLVLLWVTGIALVYTKWAGFGTLPWQFYVKLVAVLFLTVTVGYVHRCERRAREGDVVALARVETAGKVATTFAVIAVVFAVLTFD